LSKKNDCVQQYGFTCSSVHVHAFVECSYFVFQDWKHLFM